MNGPVIVAYSWMWSDAGPHVDAVLHRHELRHAHDVGERLREVVIVLLCPTVDERVARCIGARCVTARHGAIGRVCRIGRRRRGRVAVAVAR